jgi:hypothetical protein
MWTSRFIIELQHLSCKVCARVSVGYVRLHAADVQHLLDLRRLDHVVQALPLLLLERPRMAGGGAGSPQRRAREPSSGAGRGRSSGVGRGRSSGMGGERRPPLLLASSGPGAVANGWRGAVSPSTSGARAQLRRGTGWGWSSGTGLPRDQD